MLYSTYSYLYACVAGTLIAALHVIYIGPSPWATVTMFVCFVAMGLLAFVLRKHGLVLSVIVFAAILVVLTRALFLQTAENIPQLRGFHVLTGTVASEVEHRETNIRYAVNVQSVDTHAYDSFRVLVYDDLFATPVYGDTVRIQGFIDPPTQFLNDTGRMVRYDKYLASKNIYYAFFADGETVITKEASLSIRSALLSLKRTFIQALERFIPEPEAGLLKGILLGVKGALSSEIVSVFIITGLIHIVVLSGYNISIVAETVRRIFSRFPPYLEASLAITCIVLFVIIAGAETPTVRAGIMGVLVLIAFAFNKQYEALRALYAVGMLFVIIHPYALLYDTSLHLSFLATLGLLLLAPTVERHLHRVPDTFQLRGILAATVTAQCAVLPYLAIVMGQVSVLGLFANIVVLPIVPIVMLLGFITGLLGLVPWFAVIATVFGYVTYVLLAYILAVAQWVAHLPFASVTVPLLPPPVLGAILVLCVVAIVKLHARFHATHVRGQVHQTVSPPPPSLLR